MAQQIEREYNAAMGSLVELVYTKCKDDQNIAKTRAHFMTVRSVTPSEIIKLSGPQLWEHREDIVAENTSAFLDMSIDQANENYALFTSIKHLWEKSNNAERTYVVSVIKKMLSLYAKYILI